jgi:2,3-bisphosphoglycerate-independent phosphoglycerate mutase
MSQITTAVILVAGLGSRLKPLTDEVPKCLTEVNGRPILERTLDALIQNGFKKAVIVVGYLGSVVVQRIGRRFGPLEIEYIWNDIYDETNSMYSAWLARDYLKSGALLIEGDTLLDQNIFRRVLQTPEDKTYWVVNRFTPEFLGSMSTADAEGRIRQLEIVRERLAEYEDNQYKSTGVLKIAPEYGELFSQWLDDDVQRGEVQIYYDIVIARHLEDTPIYIFDVTGSKWVEIDNFDDLRLAEAEFRLTKYVIVIIDGAADVPNKKLGNRTPLEAAQLPTIDELTRRGMTGLMRTIYPGLPIGSIVANLGLLGYNPTRYYPNGRSSFEALAQNIFLDDNDITMRCNLIALQDGKIKDFTASNITDQQARQIIENLVVPNDHVVLYPGQSYRNLLITKHVLCNAKDIISFEPHHNVGKAIDGLLLVGKTPESEKLAKELNEFMLDSIEQIRELNQKLQTPADMIFLWSPSSVPWLPAFQRKYGITGSIICGLDFLRGIAYAAGLDAKVIPGATGYSDTNLQAKLQYAKNSLRYHDLVFIHVNAPDEESHRLDPEAKVRILEKIDQELVEPLLGYLESNFPGDYRIAVLPDHYTLSTDGTHTDGLVPYLIYGKGIKRGDVRQFTEKSIAEKSVSIVKSYEFMDFFLVRPVA